MPLSPDVQGQIPQRPCPSLSSEDPNEVYDLTEETDVVVRAAKLPRSSFSVPSCRFENPFPHPAQPSEDPYLGGGQHQKPDPNSVPVPLSDLWGGQHQNTDPVQPAKPSEPVVRRTLQEILDESPPPNLSFKKRDPKYDSFIEDWIAFEERTPSSIEWKYYGPGEGSDTVVVDTSKRRRSDSAFGITYYETAATDETHPDTPFWNTVDSMVRKTKEASKNLGKDAWKQIIEDQKRNWQCQVCLKSGDHISLDCPYLKYLPEGATVGPDIKVVCIRTVCALKGEHDNTKCVKRAVRMS